MTKVFAVVYSTEEHNEFDDRPKVYSSYEKARCACCLMVIEYYEGGYTKGFALENSDNDLDLQIILDGVKSDDWFVITEIEIDSKELQEENDE